MKKEYDTNNTYNTVIPYNILVGDGMTHYTHWRHQQQGEDSPHGVPPHIVAQLHVFKKMVVILHC